MKRSNLVASVFLAAVCYVSAAGPPSGFTGVRGKKSIPDTAYSDPPLIIDNNENINNGGQPEIAREDELSQNSLGASSSDKRAPSGFFGMRGKKPSEDWEEPLQQEYSMGYFKRAPNGFFGMRGKKENFYINDDYYKRAPSGFLGMRGKKAYYDFDDQMDIYEDKRVPSGFVGMRGKKDFEPFLEEIKRAPNAGFFGMRGKKQPGRSGFFGMRGKKYPYEFRGKFVGVRGKKMSNEVSANLDEQLQRLGQGLDFNQLMILLTENEALDPANSDLLKQPQL